jgi:hypothetical protein
MIGIRPFYATGVTHHPQATGPAPIAPPPTPRLTPAQGALQTSAPAPPPVTGRPPARCPAPPDAPPPDAPTTRPPRPACAQVPQPRLTPSPIVRDETNPPPRRITSRTIRDGPRPGRAPGALRHGRFETDPNRAERPARYITDDSRPARTRQSARRVTSRTIGEGPRPGRGPGESRHGRFETDPDRAGPGRIPSRTIREGRWLRGWVRAAQVGRRAGPGGGGCRSALRSTSRGAR